MPGGGWNRGKPSVWTTTRDDELRRLWGTKSAPLVAKELGAWATPWAVRTRARKLNLACLSVAYIRAVSPLPRPAPEDVWLHIDKRAGPNACWPWLKAKTKSGYGAMNVDLGRGYKQYGTHVIVMWLLHGQATERGTNLVVRHKCDNPICCNPNHLQLGSFSDNSRDMVKRGRLHKNHARGEALPFSKLDGAKVAEMRAIHARGGISCRQLGEKFGISKSATLQVIRGETWKHV